MSPNLPDLTTVQAAVGKLAQAVGHGSRLVRWGRPAYEAGLLWLSGGRGIDWSINGVPCRIDPRQRHRIPRVYEPEVAEFLADRIRPDSVCLDIGANVGAYAIQMAHWSRPTGRVYAFEPNPRAATILVRHIRCNELSERVEIVPTAVGAGCGETTFYATEADGMSRLAAPNPLVADRAQPVQVPITTVDRFCRERRLAPDWILIDIEGFEHAALRGAHETIRTGDSALGVLVEMHPSAWPTVGITPGDFTALLKELRRKPIPLSGQTDPLADYGVVLLESQ